MSALRIRGLSIGPPTGELIVHGIDLDIPTGTCHGLVGESGSGKSLTLRAVLGLLPGGLTMRGGSVELAGRQMTDATPKQWRAVRGSVVALVPQDASTGLNPLMRVGDQIAEAALVNGAAGRRAAQETAADWMTRVGLSPDVHFRALPHQLSGGQRQRVAIAMAFCPQPQLVLCDEPTSALDVTVQKRILALISSVVADTGTSLLFVTHDLPVAAAVTTDVTVLARGRVVESGPTRVVLGDPQAEYTRALVAAVPGSTEPGTQEPGATKPGAPEPGSTETGGAER